MVGSSSSAAALSCGAWGATRGPGRRLRQTHIPATMTAPLWDPPRQWPPRLAYSPRKAAYHRHPVRLPLPPRPAPPLHPLQRRKAATRHPWGRRVPCSRTIGTKTAGLSSGCTARPPAAFPLRTVRGSARRSRALRIQGWGQRPGKDRDRDTQKHSRSEHRRRTRNCRTSTLRRPRRGHLVHCRLQEGTIMPCRPSYH